MEVWREVQGYNGRYLVSNKGRIASVYWGTKKRSKPKIIKGCWDKDGYIRLSLRADSKTPTPKTEKLHRLVALSFLPNDDDTLVVNHKDGDKCNNNVDNLEWVTVQYNTIHGIQLRKQNGDH